MIKTEVLNAFFISVINSKTSCPLSAQPLKLEGRGKEQNEAPIMDEEMVSDIRVYGTG